MFRRGRLTEIILSQVLAPLVAYVAIALIKRNVGKGNSEDKLEQDYKKESSI